MRAQLRSHVLGDQISLEGAPVAYTYDLDGMRNGLTLARLGQLTRTPRERRADPGPLTEIAEAYADLSDRYEAAHPRRVELLAIAATMWSLVGLPGQCRHTRRHLHPRGTVPVRARRA